MNVTSYGRWLICNQYWNLRRWVTSLARSLILTIVVSNFDIRSSFTFLTLGIFWIICFTVWYNCCFFSLEKLRFVRQDLIQSVYIYNYYYCGLVVLRISLFLLCLCFVTCISSSKLSSDVLCVCLYHYCVFV